MHVNDHQVVALVDTGATHSFIRRSLARKLKLEFHKRPAMAIGFGNESREDADKEVRVHLQIGNKRRKWTFVVLDIAADPLILGEEAVLKWGFRD